VKSLFDWSQPLASHVPNTLRPILALAALVLTGTLLLMLPISGTTRALTWNEAMFTTVSALTVTGLSVIAPGRDLTLFGQAVLLVLIQLGGVGAMALAVVLLRVLGWTVGIDNRLALRDSLGLNSVRDVLGILRRAFVVIAGTELTGAVLLFAIWSPGSPLPVWQTAWYALFHAVSAMCNAGFDLFGGMPQFPAGLPTGDATLLVLCTLIFIGGIGIPVMGDVLRREKLRFHSKLALGTSVFLIIFGAAGMLLAESGARGVLVNEPDMLRRITLSLAQSVSARTAGFAFYPAFDQITEASRFMLMTLMFIGASPASMGGGIKTVTFAVLVIGLFSYLRQMPALVFGRRTIAPSALQKASAVLVAALFLVLTAIFLLTLLLPDAALDLIMFEVISAFATCGLSLNFTGQLSIPAQLIIMFVMFWGRLGALTIINAIAAPVKRAAVRFPEAELFVG
jgi:trk system potassium uptake protein